jgi:hypothetical protein
MISDDQGIRLSYEAKQKCRSKAGNIAWALQLARRVDIETWLGASAGKA